MKFISLCFFVVIAGLGHASNANNEDFVVGKYKLHFNQDGDVIAPDEYYVFQAIKNEKDGFKKMARQDFQRAASYGNTFGMFYTGLLYLQENDSIKGYAWLSMVDTDRFPFANRVIDLMQKLEVNLTKDEVEKANQFTEELKKYYGVSAGFNRRLKWSKDFKLTGSNIKGYIPNRLSIQTNFSHGTIGKMNANVSTMRLEKNLKQFVFEYEMDYRLTEGEVKMGEMELIEKEK